ncbi:Uncharacterised protein [uncultured archaeon]|nr:Uncharacterised protein [uncultured archaeon]
MRKIYYVLILLVGIVFASGCVQYPPANRTGNVTPTNQTQENVTISIVSAPANSTAGMPFAITWSVGGPGKTISHTAIHYDYVPHPGTLGEDVGPPGGYAYLTPDFASGTFYIPNTFTANITPTQAGTLYYRAHVIVDGSNYWTNERTINVASNVTNITTGQKSFAIDADDNGFYMNNVSVSSIPANISDMITLTFNVRPANVYYRALDFRGCGQEADGVATGNSTIMRLTVNGACNITSYWPASNVTRAALLISVGNVTGNVSGNATGQTGGGTTGGGGYSYSGNGGYYY